MTRLLRIKTIAGLLFGAVSVSHAQQVMDSAFVPTIHNASRTFGRGVVIAIDEAHNNFHTVNGRFGAFAALARSVGYSVTSSPHAIDSASLARIKLLVIANAVDSAHRLGSAWRLPAVSAFTSGEIAALSAWVKRGGALLLIADHMPFAGAAEDLAAAFGVTFVNGFAMPGAGTEAYSGSGNIVFRRVDNTLRAHAVTRGTSAAERVDSVVSFTGSAFWMTPDVASFTPLMTLRPTVRVRLPIVAWQFSDSTPEIRGGGLLQGAVLAHGTGRVGVFGEAAMFTAQLGGANRVPMGMNAPIAAQNAQFVVNLLRWLTTTR